MAVTNSIMHVTHQSGKDRKISCAWRSPPVWFDNFAPFSKSRTLAGVLLSLQERRRAGEGADHLLHDATARGGRVSTASPGPPDPGRDGDRVGPWETVMLIRGPYAAFAHLETLYVGVWALEKRR